MSLDKYRNKKSNQTSVYLEDIVSSYMVLGRKDDQMMDIEEKGWEKSVMDGENEKILKVKAAAAASTHTDQKRD